MVIDQQSFGAQNPTPLILVVYHLINNLTKGLDALSVAIAVTVFFRSHGVRLICSFVGTRSLASSIFLLHGPVAFDILLPNASIWPPKFSVVFTSRRLERVYMVLLK